VVAQRAIALVVFAGQDQYVVAVDYAPDCGEWVAEAEIDAADGTAGGGECGPVAGVPGWWANKGGPVAGAPGWWAN
jgi:hypothetical protein